MHLATRGNNKILRTHPPHISSSEETSRLTRRTHVQLRTNKSPFLKSYLHKVDANHIHHHYAPLQHPHTRHTPSLQLNPQTHHTVTLDFWTDPAGVMELLARWRYAGWWIKGGMIGLPHKKKNCLFRNYTLCSVHGVGRHNNNIQGSWEIDHQLSCTCLEYKPTRHKLQQHPIYTEQRSEDCHWLSQDVQCRPPTRRS